MLEHRGNKTWVEPFVGGGNMIDKVDGIRFGCDSNRYTIEALISIRDDINRIPKDNKEFTEAMYKELRGSDNYEFKGYASFAFSYSGKFLGGWRRDGANKRDYVNESYRNAVNQSPKLQGVRLECSLYSDIKLNEPCIIYCDPPYANTTKYKDDFNHDIFWQWCRDMVNDGHIVFVSEYNAPDDFKCLWEKEIVSSLTKDTGSKKAVEKLFFLGGKI